MRWSTTSVCYFNNKKYAKFMKEKGGIICLLWPSCPTCLLLCPAYKMNEVIFFHADPRSWPEPGQVQGIVGEVTPKLPVMRHRLKSSEDLDQRTGSLTYHLGMGTSVRISYHSVFSLCPATSICVFHTAESDGFLNFRSLWHKPLK